MVLVTHIGLTLLVLCLGLTVFLQGKKGMLAAAGILSAAAMVKGLAWVVPGTLACTSLLSLLLEGKIQAWVQDRSQGSLFPGLIGSVVLLLLFGCFLSPVSSLVVWITIFGLKMLPQLRHVLPLQLIYWGNTIYRGCLSLITLAAGLYVINK